MISEFNSEDEVNSPNILSDKNHIFVCELLVLDGNT